MPASKARDSEIEDQSSLVYKAHRFRRRRLSESAMLPAPHQERAIVEQPSLSASPQALLTALDLYPGPLTSTPSRKAVVPFRSDMPISKDFSGIMYSECIILTNEPRDPIYHPLPRTRPPKSRNRVPGSNPDRPATIRQDDTPSELVWGAIPLRFPRAARYSDRCPRRSANVLGSSPSPSDLR